MEGIMRTIALLALFALLSACATVGKDFDLSLLDQLEVNVSTVDDAVALFGPHSSQTVGPTGIATYGWSYGHTNGLTGRSESRALFLSFGADGKLLQKSSSELRGR